MYANRRRRDRASREGPRCETNGRRGKATADCTSDPRRKLRATSHHAVSSRSVGPDATHVEYGPYRLVNRTVNSGVGGEPRDGAAQRLELCWPTSFDVEEEAGLHGPGQRVDVGARARALVVRQGDPPGARNVHDLRYRALDEPAAARRVTHGTNGRAGQPAHGGHGGDEHELLPQLDFHRPGSAGI